MAVRCCAVPFTEEETESKRGKDCKSQPWPGHWPYNARQVQVLRRLPLGIRGWKWGAPWAVGKRRGQGGSLSAPPSAGFRWASSYWVVLGALRAQDIRWREQWWAWLPGSLEVVSNPTQGSPRVACLGPRV